MEQSQTESEEIIACEVGDKELAKFHLKINGSDWYQTVFRLGRPIYASQLVGFLRGCDIIAYKKKDGELMGILGIYNRNPRDVSCEILSVLFRDPGDVVRIEVIKKFINWCFEQAGIRKLKVIFFTNDICVDEFKTAGFVVEGNLKKEIFTNKKFRDVVVMGLVNDNYGE